MNKSFGEFFLSCKECILENPRSFYGSFSLGPFQNSQSLTIANAFRRTLLTEIRGIAITDVQIDGVFHEYSTIEGVRESVLDILLNFKQIILSASTPQGTGGMWADEPRLASQSGRLGGREKPMYGYLNVRGPGIVRISDLKLPPTVQYVDPDQYIATLNENGKLCLKVLISDFSSLNTFHFGKTAAYPLQKESAQPRAASAPQSGGGLGQSPAAFHPIGEEGGAGWGFSNQYNRDEEKKKSQQASSFILPSTGKKGRELWKGLNTPFLSVDATFNPILKVNYLIENLQPIQKSLQNQVIHIELWTNGSIHPRNAINLSLTFLKNMFDKFDDMDKISSKISKEFFESDETLFKILKSFEYDFHLYGALEAKKMAGSFLALPESNAVAEHAEPVSNLPTSRAEPAEPAEPEATVKQLKNQQAKQKSSTFLSSAGSARGATGASGAGQISLNSSIHVLNLPYRVSECLIRNKFLTLGDLAQFRKKEFAQFPGIGHFSLSLIQKKLKKLGFEFKS